MVYPLDFGTIYVTAGGMFWNKFGRFEAIRSTPEVVDFPQMKEMTHIW